MTTKGGEEPQFSFVAEKVDLSRGLFHNVLFCILGLGFVVVELMLFYRHTNIMHYKETII